MEERVYRQMALIEESHWWFVGRRRIVSGLLGHLHLPKRARILEVGCGTGGNTEMLQSFGEVVSIEPNETARALAAVKGRSKVLDGALPHRLPDGLGQFDLVVALDVLEHIDDDRGSLKVLKDHLKPADLACFRSRPSRFFGAPTTWLITTSAATRSRIWLTRCGRRTWCRSAPAISVSGFSRWWF